MIMKKNGFVSTSLIYTFFIVFLLLMVYLLNSYSRIRFLLEEYKYDIKESFATADVGDISLYFYVKSSVTGEYEMVNNMPMFGYVFQSEFSYCKNGSVITAQGGNVSVAVTRKDSCYAYFDPIETDIILEIYKKESSNGSRIKVNAVPSAAYSYVSGSCSNGTIEFNEETRKFKISASTKTKCVVDFVRKDMDININMYKQSATGEKVYNGVNYTFIDNVPSGNYILNAYQCINNNTDITVDSSTGDLIVNSRGENTCDVYFKFTGGDDIEVIIMQETETGITGYTTGKYYSRVYAIPNTSSGTGFKYVGYICEDPSATLTFSGGTITATSSVQTTCRAYFDKYTSNQAIINYYLGTSDGGYEKVMSVPEVGYAFNSSKSKCKNNSTYNVYNNYVVVSATTDDEECDFYYDITEPDVKVLIYVMNRETNVWELSSIPASGYTVYSAGCTNNASIEFVNSKIEVTTEGPTVCKVYYR